MESKFSFFQAPFMAFFSSDLYKDVASNWKGSGSLYIFMVTSVAWLISCIATFLPLVQVMNNPDVAAALNQLPKMVIADGKMTIDKPVPYELKEPKSGVVYALFATDRTTEEMKENDPPIVVTQNAIIMRGDLKSSPYAAAGNSDSKDDSEEGKETGTPILKFADLSSAAPKLEMDGPTLQSALNQICLIVPIAVLFIGWPFVFMGHLIQMLIYGGIGMLIANGMEKEINFEKAMRLAAIAITPNVIISVFLSVTKAAVPIIAPLAGMWTFGSIAVAIAYLFMVIRAIDKPTRDAAGAL